MNKLYLSITIIITIQLLPMHLINGLVNTNSTLIETNDQNLTSSTPHTLLSTISIWMNTTTSSKNAKSEHSTIPTPITTMPKPITRLQPINTSIPQQHQFLQRKKYLIDSVGDRRPPSPALPPENLNTIINRENLIRREPNLSYTSSGCHSCQMREKVKAENLESIKRHVLLRLEMKSSPNITIPIVPRQIIEKFYMSHTFEQMQNSNIQMQSQFQPQTVNENNLRAKGTIRSSETLTSDSHSSISKSNTRSTSSSSSSSISSSSSTSSESSSSSQNRNDRKNSKIPTINEYDGMFGDDPNSYKDNKSTETQDDDVLFDNIDPHHHYHHHHHHHDDDEDVEEDFYSIVNSFFIFPTAQIIRHGRKSEVLHFQFNNGGQFLIAQAILHIHIRGRDWFHQTETTTINDDFKEKEFDKHQNQNPIQTTTKMNQTSKKLKRKEIVLAIYKTFLRPSSQNQNQDARLNLNSNSNNGSEKLTEIKIPIPNVGDWMTADITEIVKSLMAITSSNLKNEHGIIFKVTELWMKNLISSDDTGDGSNPAYIEVITKDYRRRRTKRNALNCSDNQKEDRCCRYPLTVNFSEFEWDWIIAPTFFNAHYCSGDCNLGLLLKYPHTHIMQLSPGPMPCCSPTKMSSVKLLYFNNDQILVMSTIPNMVVDKCSCS